MDAGLVRVYLSRNVDLVSCRVLYHHPACIPKVFVRGASRHGTFPGFPFQSLS